MMNIKTIFLIGLFGMFLTGCSHYPYKA